MIQYILECIAFQLVFLIIYDLFLKRETFFQWNRAYLIGTYMLSIVLPWIKIEAFRTKVTTNFTGYSEFLWNLNQQPVLLNSQTVEAPLFTSQELIFLIGAILASVWFGIKMWRLYQLRKQGDVHYFRNFTQILIPKSSVAFSFFKSIFLGESLPKKEYEAIISHELVHIRQRHTLDFLFFELMRIISWFNPLVYVYQSRISELHEFIADAQVPKTERKAHYDLLLSQVFQTQHISFVNQFFKSSLIKKRIVMLNKSKSNKVWQLKYFLLVPLIVGMLFYTSCEQDISPSDKFSPNLIVEGSNLTLKLNDLNNSTEEEEHEKTKVFAYMRNNVKNGTLLIIDNLKNHMKIIFKEGEVVNVSSMMENEDLNSDNNSEVQSLAHLYNQLVAERKRLLESTDESNQIIINLDNQLQSIKEAMVTLPFAIVDEVPIFPGCENATDKKNCFNEMMQNHISANFKYPEEAQDKGIQGRVNAMFVILRDGSISDVKMRGPDKMLEDEVGRIISKLPKMKPGKQKGRKVNVPYSIPVTFKL